MLGTPQNPLEALARLQAGNRRFASHVVSINTLSSQLNRDDLIKVQSPSAIVLGCSDSRAPAEIVFDQGLGDLFVIRVAGNIVAPSQVGSVEFAVERFGTQLVVVMGHTGCGAITATVESIERPGSMSPGLSSIVDRVRPSVQGLIGSPYQDRAALLREAVRANVRVSANQLRHASASLEQLVLDGKLLVVGAEYQLETGIVDFFDGVP